MAARVWRPLAVRPPVPGRHQVPDPVTGAQQRARQIMADNGFRDLGRGDGGCQVDVDVDAAVAQQVHQVLGGDVAGRPRCERAAAEPADRGVQPGDPGADRGVGAGQAGAAGVVEMSAQRQVADHRAQLCDQRSHPSRGGGADGVGDREPVDAPVAGGRGDVEHPLRRGRPLERAVPRGGDDDLDGDVAVVRDGDDLSDLIGGLRGAAPDVGLAERVVGRHHVLDRPQPGGDRPLGAVGTGDQGGELDVGVIAQVGGEFGGVGHRRHLGGGDERRGLHLADPGGGHRGQQFQLGRQRDWGFDLQAVAQRHLANIDVLVHSTSSARNSSSSSAVLRSIPM